MHPTPTTRKRPPATTLAGLAAAALVSAVIPAAAGLAFLISLAVRRPLVAVAARRWPWLTGHSAAPPPHRALTGLTAAWGIGLLAAGAVQGAGALTGGPALTSPSGFTARALIALAIQAILAALTITWLHRSPAPGPQAGSATPDPSLDRSSWVQDHHDLSPDRR
jgi:hypothetical protein